MAQGDGVHQPSGLGTPDQAAFVRARPDSDPLESESTGDQTNRLEASGGIHVVNIFLWNDRPS
jgi:hypothetical protein